MAADAEAAHSRFLLDVKALPEDEIPPFRMDADLAIANVNTAMPWLLAKLSELAEHLPKIPPEEVESLPELAMATKFAVMEAESTVPSQESVSERLSQAYPIRSTLLATMRALAAIKAVPAPEVAKVARGRGPRDVAEDCVSLAKMFRKYAEAIEGKHGITPEQIDEAAEVGTWLLATLKPADAPSATSATPTKPPAIDIRDRFAALLIKRYNQAEMVARYFYGPDYAEKVPPLQSRKVKKKNDDEGES